MDATRWMPRIGAACAALMLLVLAVPAGASAAATINRPADGAKLKIVYESEPNMASTVTIRYDQDDPTDWILFTRTGGTMTAGNAGGCQGTAVAIGRCPWSENDVTKIELVGSGLDDAFTLTDAWDEAPDQAVPIVVHAGAGNDTTHAGDGADQLVASDGNDKFAGLLSAGDDVAGGAGEDTVELPVAAPGTTITLDDIPGDGAGANVRSDVEVLLGGNGADRFTGSTGAQRLEGRGGADTLDPGPGSDTVLGGPGNDEIAVRDGEVDTVDCGGDPADHVVADFRDVLTNCPAPGVERSPQDDDRDGVAPPADCNDASAAIKPGAGDVPGNGVDEDCDGSDAVLDRDGDGAAAGVDCDDANPARRPGAVDVPANGIDEDCSGADAKRATVAATFSTGWSVFRRWTVLTKLQVKGAPAGAKLQVRCKGKGCPFARKSVKLKNGAAKLTKLFKGKRLKPGAVVELRVTAAGTIGKVQRLTVRKRKDPKRTALCLAPGASKPSKCA